MLRTITFSLFGLSVLILIGCEANGDRPVAATETRVIETPLTSDGRLSASIQTIREAILQAAVDQRMRVLVAPADATQGEAVLQPPSGPNVLVHYQQLEPGVMDVRVYRNSSDVEMRHDELSRRVFTNIRSYTAR